MQWWRWHKPTALGATFLLAAFVCWLVVGPGTGGRAAAQNKTVTISMEGVKFLPADLTVTKGTTVVWQNDSQLAHTVTARDGSFDSGNLAVAASFTQTFDREGTYRYFCRPHETAGMVGEINVLPERGAAPQGYSGYERVTLHVGSDQFEADGRPAATYQAAFGENLGQPYVDANGRTQVPLRALAYLFGVHDAGIRWYGPGNALGGAPVQRVEIDFLNTTAVFRLDGRITVTDTTGKVVRNVTTDTDAIHVRQDRTYVPLRFAGRAFGLTDAQIGWRMDGNRVDQAIFDWTAVPNPAITALVPLRSDPVAATFPLQVHVAGWTLSPDTFGQAQAIPGVGHYHVYWGEQLLAATADTTVNISGLPAGTHELRLALAFDNHTVLDSTDTITVTVGE